MRDLILSEIRRLAAASGGRPPGERLFSSETGIAKHQWSGRFWARWSEALTEAGCPPNERTQRLDSDEILAGVISTCRHLGRVPTYAELEIRRRSDPSIPTTRSITRHFATRSGLLAALAHRAAEEIEYADIGAMIPNLPPSDTTLQPKSARAQDGFVYLIKSGGYYKVGRSDDLERRVKEIRVALPDKANLVHTIRTDDPPGIETYWHNRFKDKRANGEWFKLSSADVLAFKKRKFQ